MNIPRPHLILLFCILSLMGCSTVRQAILNRFSAGPQKLWGEKALAFEAQGEYQQALLAWRVAARLDPGNKEIPGKIETLETKIRQRGRTSFKEGVEAFEKGDLENARRQFLTALRIMPEHKGALAYLKNRVPNRENRIYNVARGDSYSKIASEVYNDPAKAALIAFFNDRAPDQALHIGTELVLPQLPRKEASPSKETDTLLQRAKSALAQKRYREVFQITSQIEARHPGHPQARELRDEVYFQRGMSLLEQKKYASAMAQLKQIGPNHPGREKALERARKHLATEAGDRRLVQAQGLLDEKSYTDAIAICEEILMKDPFNRKAKAIFNAAHYAWGKKLLEEENEIEAITVLNALDQGYQDTGQLVAQARAQLNARAESLYRKGVRLFLNEELEKAISAWEQVLKLNPDHPKARQDIANAKRLLEKWRELDQ